MSTDGHTVKVSTPNQKKAGEMTEHFVKPLEIIWRKCPQWTAKNTLAVDDLRRNFALNPGNGIVCSAYRRKKTAPGTDDPELPRIAAYLNGVVKGGWRMDVGHEGWRERMKEWGQ